jgi:RNA polymerase sigma-70 factor (ECF subfamily)
MTTAGTGTRPDAHRDLAANLEEHRRELTAHCRRLLGSATDADDAVQEALWRAWRRLDGFEHRSSLRTWLYRIATNVCIDMRRRRSLQPLPVDIAGELRPGDGLPVLDASRVHPPPGARARRDAGDAGDAAVAREDVRLAFAQLLRRLPPRQRAVLVLCDVLHWRAPEAAELLGTTIASVTSARQRAREALAAPHRHTARATGPVDLDACVEAFHRDDVTGLLVALRPAG